MKEQVYEKAAELLQEKGWWQGGIGNAYVSYRKSGGSCIGMAIADAARQLGNGLLEAYREEFVVPLLRALGAGGSDWLPLMKWNDDPARTEEDVLLLLKYGANGELETWRELYGEGVT